MSEWTPVSERLPEDGQRVLCFLPENGVYLPGKSGTTEQRQVVVLRFLKDHFLKHSSKTGYTGVAHFWQGEGSRNHFFADVTHWMPLPQEPQQ